MIGTPTTDTLAQAVISGAVHQGFSVTGRDGRPARLAIIDEHGNVIESGEAVAREAWAIAIACHRNYLQGLGHLRVHTSPTGIVTAAGKKSGRSAA